MAIWIMAVRLLDLFWLIQPTFHPAVEAHGQVLAPLNFQVVAVNLVNVLAIGGLWLTIFWWQLGKRSLLPVHDPKFPAMMEAKHHG
jgi:hypothetical protein